MSNERLLLSPKYQDFIRTDAKVEMLEGVTYAGKTTVGLFKFMLKVAQSEKRLHIVAAKDTGTAEKNLINRDLGLLDHFGVLTTYNGNGTKDEKIPHICFDTGKGVKIIYVLGYGDRKKWEKALGGQYGCLYIDEINTADMDFVRESMMRSDYVMGTLNPDDPELPIYREYVNHCRPLPRYADDAPAEINAQLNLSPKQGWVHWFFNFSDNLSLSATKLQRITENVPVGTKLWKNKILGIRGRATGLVFSNFERHQHVIREKDLFDDTGRLKHRFRYFSCGVDTAYSTKSPDTIAFIFQGIDAAGRLIVLDEEVYNNATLTEPIAPSDTVKRLIEFVTRNASKWGPTKAIFIDSADQATLTEFRKYKRRKGTVWNATNAWKKTTIINRINLQLGWLAQGYYLVLDHCIHHIREMETYAWKEDKAEPEDGNDHTINASQYGWLPYKRYIGTEEQRRMAGEDDE